MKSIWYRISKRHTLMINSKRKFVHIQKMIAFFKEMKLRNLVGGDIASWSISATCRLSFKKNFAIDFPTKAEWNTGDVLRSYDAVFFTFESKVKSKRECFQIRIVCRVVRSYGICQWIPSGGTVVTGGLSITKPFWPTTKRPSQLCAGRDTQSSGSVGMESTRTTWKPLTSDGEGSPLTLS